MDRQVTKSRKDHYGDILVLCNPGAAWSPRLKQDAIRDTETGLHTYFVRWTDGQRSEIRVVQGPTGKYLRTDKDDPTRNNLEDLPDC
ncbi:MAG TPA: DUF3892 domain-containing protein [Gemmatimonadota bacterium]|nr:DUF3892 domain-containing protein [Gemmatimonadota bacterium]